MTEMMHSEPTIDEEAFAPPSRICSACGAPLDLEDRFCNACGSSQQPAREEQAEAIEQKHFRCENCGSEVATDLDQRSYVCAFCDSTYVVEFSPEQTGRQRPEFVIGFAVTQERAQQMFREWLTSNSWFRPGDLKTAQVAEKLKGVYLPFWSFSMLAESRWEASIGEHWYRTETYTTMRNGKMVTRTRQVQETEWWPLEGQHHHYYSGYLVSGSRGLGQTDADRIKPFHLAALRRYEPYFLAGWLSEEYSIETETARAHCEEEFRRREEQNVGALMPGDTHRKLRVGSTFSNINSDLILLPIYVLSYRYQEKVYRFLINGQTGKHTGDKPVSTRRIAAAVASGLLFVLLMFLLFLLLKG